MSTWSLASSAVGVSVPVSTTRPHHDQPSPLFVYLLHGTVGCGEDWADRLPLQEMANTYGATFIAPSLGNAWARIDASGRDWLTFLARALLLAAEGGLQQPLERDRRWLVGISAGGYSALRMAMQFPELFARCGAFSPGGLWIDVYLEYLRQLDPATMENPHLRDVFGDDLRCLHDDVLLNLAASAATNVIGSDLVITMGDEHELKPPCDAFVDRVRTLGLACDYRTGAGGHDWMFWQQSLTDFLETAASQER